MRKKSLAGLLFEAGLEPRSAALRAPRAEQLQLAHDAAAPLYADIKSERVVLGSSRGQGTSSRMAELLEHAALCYPGVLVPYDYLTEAVFALHRCPNLRGRRVDAVKSRLRTVRKILAAEYERGLVVRPGIGVRATVDADGDWRMTALTVAGARHAASARALARHLLAIDPARVGDRELVEQYIDAIEQISPLMVAAKTWSALRAQHQRALEHFRALV